MSPKGAAVLAAGIAAAATPLFGGLARASGLLDPPGGRKDHARPTPLLGGAAVLLAFAVGLAAARRGLARNDAVILGACAVAFAVGLLDDLAKARFPAWAKFLGQGAAALLAAAGGIRSGWVAFGPADLALSALFLLAAVNATNFLDNMDGLAAGLAAAAAATLAGLGEASRALPLLGACAGFLPWNFPRARVFLGDAGSHALGLAAGALALRACAKSSGSLPERALPLLALALPLLDLVRVVAARVRLRRPPHVGDHLHLSHRAAARGLGRARATLALTALAFAFGAAALAAADRGRAAALAAEGGVVGAFVLAARLLRGRGGSTRGPLSPTRTPSCRSRSSPRTQAAPPSAP